MFHLTWTSFINGRYIISFNCVLCGEIVIEKHTYLCIFPFIKSYVFSIHPVVWGCAFCLIESPAAVAVGETTDKPEGGGKPTSLVAPVFQQRFSSYQLFTSKTIFLFSPPLSPVNTGSFSTTSTVCLLPGVLWSMQENVLYHGRVTGTPILAFWTDILQSIKKNIWFFLI